MSDARITIEIEGAEDVARWMERFGDEVVREVEREVKRAALKVTTNVKRAIQKQPKTGTLYKRGPKGRTAPDGVHRNLSPEHRASAKDQAPATDTGFLVSSVYFKQTSPLSMEVGSRLAYAAALEFGTVRMDARPSWQPAVAEVRPEFEAAVAAAMRKATKR